MWLIIIKSKNIFRLYAIYFSTKIYLIKLKLIYFKIKKKTWEIFKYIIVKIFQEMILFVDKLYMNKY